MVVWVQKKGKMASNNSKYTLEYRKEICQLIVNTGRSATSVSEEMGIDKNTACICPSDSEGTFKLLTPL